MVASRKKLIYLASPYAHPDPQVMTARAEEVAACAAMLLREGHHVFCPIAHGCNISATGLVPEGYDWLSLDLQVLGACDEVWVLCLDGVEESKGVAAEVAAAKSRGMPVHFMMVDVVEAKA